MVVRYILTENRAFRKSLLWIATFIFVVSVSFCRFKRAEGVVISLLRFSLSLLL